MSLRSILSNLLPRLGGTHWGTRLPTPEGRKDTQVQPLAEELFAGISSEAPIELNSPLVLINRTNQPAIQIINVGPTNQNSGVSITNEAGQQTNLGIGLGNQGILANEFIPLAPFAIDPMQSWIFLGQGNYPTYGQLSDGYGVNVPPPGPGTQPEQTSPGFKWQDGQPYLPGVPIGGSQIPTQPTTLPNSPYVPGNQGNPFTLHPILPQAIAAALGKTVTVVGGCGISVTQQNSKYTVVVNGSALAGAGLTATDCSLAVNPGDGIEVSSDQVKAKVACGLELSGGSIRVKRADLIGNGLKAGGGTCDIEVDLTDFNGVSDTVTVVTNVECVDDEIVVTTSDLTFTNGLLTGVA